MPVSERNPFAVPAQLRRVAGSVEDFVARAVQIADAPRCEGFRDAIRESRHLL
jgi:hypothetical protein